MYTAFEPRHLPVAIAAFEGWNDAGDAASDALFFLRDAWEATKIATISAEEYVDYSMTRPTVHRSAGSSWLMWPDTTIWKARAPLSGESVYLIHGVEPAFRWRRYAERLLQILAEHDVNTFIGVGALLADIPHTRTLPVYLSTEDEAVQEELDITSSEFEGPTGILGVLNHMAHTQGLTSVSAWAAVPHYVSASPSPQATLVLVKRLSTLLNEVPDTEELEEDAEAWLRGVAELADADPEVAAYVRALEDARDAAESPEASGDAIAAEFERYLRRRGPSNGPEAQ